jgi:hypothetical protein
MNLRKEELEKLQQETDEELISIMCDFHEEKRHLAKFIYDNRCRDREQKFNREQNELLHKRNTELVEKQLKWVKISAAITALATLAGVVLGWYLKELKQVEYRHTIPQQQTLKQQTLSSPIGHLPSNSIASEKAKEKAKEEQKIKK